MSDTRAVRDGEGWAYELAAREIPDGAAILIRLPEEPISAARAEAVHEQATLTFPGHRIVIVGAGMELEAITDDDLERLERAAFHLAACELEAKLRRLRGGESS